LLINYLLKDDTEFAFNLGLEGGRQLLPELSWLTGHGKTSHSTANLTNSFMAAKSTLADLLGGGKGLSEVTAKGKRKDIKPL
jgi:hypothetical protein